MCFYELYVACIPSLACGYVALWTPLPHNQSPMQNDKLTCLLHSFCQRNFFICYFCEDIKCKDMLSDGKDENKRNPACRKQGSQAALLNKSAS
jgi:hypothetical protein